MAEPSGTPSAMEFALQKLIVRYSPLFEQHQWPEESLRWTELAFALATRISPRPEAEIRRTVEEMDLLGLLEVETLAGLAGPEGGVDFAAGGARRMEEHLLENGLASGEARALILALHELAVALRERFEGRIQLYLRRYGERMLDELAQNFRFSRLSPEQARSAFSYWLQNVLGMPVPLRTPAVQAFCGRLGVTEEELVAAADRLDLNLALADDMIELEEAARREG
ncbi:hypothetical protein SH611_06165 [Geminicoccaceae bacterium 1502E]|nr:hypothetical protein [Geminicoccaceae bacterium 1502E]